MTKIKATDLTIGQRLKFIREQKGLSQEKFAKSVGIGHKNYGHFENDARMIGMSALMEISKAYGMSADFILFGNMGTFSESDSQNFSDWSENI